MLAESEYLGIIERYQRAMMGDKEMLGPLFDQDLPRLLADWREWQRTLEQDLPDIRARLASAEGVQSLLGLLKPGSEGSNGLSVTKIHFDPDIVGRAECGTQRKATPVFSVTSEWQDV